jgi:hypothetical protein
MIRLIMTSAGIIITSAIETLGSALIKIISRQIVTKSTKKIIVSFFSKMCQFKVAPNVKAFVKAWNFMFRQLVQMLN